MGFNSSSGSTVVTGQVNMESNFQIIPASSNLTPWSRDLIGTGSIVNVYTAPANTRLHVYGIQYSANATGYVSVYNQAGTLIHYTAMSIANETRGIISNVPILIIEAGEHLRIAATSTEHFNVVALVEDNS